MSDGVIIASVMVFMFGFIFFYVYGGEKMRARRESLAAKKKFQAKQEKEARLKALIDAKKAVRDKFYGKMRKRSEAIKREFQWLEQFKKRQLS